MSDKVLLDMGCISLPKVRRVCKHIDSFLNLFIECFDTWLCHGSLVKLQTSIHYTLRC